MAQRGRDPLSDKAARVLFSRSTKSRAAHHTHTHTWGAAPRQESWGSGPRPVRAWREHDGRLHAPRLHFPVDPLHRFPDVVFFGVAAAALALCEQQDVFGGVKHVALATRPLLKGAAAERVGQTAVPAHVFAERSALELCAVAARAVARSGGGAAAAPVFFGGPSGAPRRGRHCLDVGAQCFAQEAVAAGVGVLRVPAEELGVAQHFVALRRRVQLVDVVGLLVLRGGETMIVGWRPDILEERSPARRARARGALFRPRAVRAEQRSVAFVAPPVSQTRATGPQWHAVRARDVLVLWGAHRGRFASRGPRGRGPHERRLGRGLVAGGSWHRALALDVIFRVLLPPFLFQFLALPCAVGLPLRGEHFCFTTFLNMVGAEVVTNVWAFVTILPNHAGADLWSFATPCKADSPEFLLRAVLASTAFTAGNDVVDYLHGYLNYQAEHHAFPELSPLHYQRLSPRFKAVCLRHCVPYVQESCLVRTRKMAAVAVGVAKTKRLAKGQAVDQPEKWMLSPAKYGASEKY